MRLGQRDDGHISDVGKRRIHSGRESTLRVGHVDRHPNGFLRGSDRGSNQSESRREESD
jgi:hypothetical protein